MDKTLLVPLDNTEVSEKMIREADAWAAHLGSRVSFLHVINPNYSWGEEKKPLFEERFEKAIHSCEVKSQYEVLFRVGKPYPKILEMEEELKPLMILMAAHDHTVLERLFLGSNTDHILHHGHTPVMVYKGLFEEMENKILVPIDYTDISRELLQKADEWALWHDAKMMIMHVDEVPEYCYDSDLDSENRLSGRFKPVNQNFSKSTIMRLPKNFRESGPTQKFLHCWCFSSSAAAAWDGGSVSGNPPS